MPCDTIYTVNEVDFLPKNWEILHKAIQALGWRIRRENKEEHIMTVTDNSYRTVIIANNKAKGEVQSVNALRVQYAQNMTDAAVQFAKSKGWQVQRTGERTLSIRKLNQ